MLQLSHAHRMFLTHKPFPRRFPLMLSGFLLLNSLAPFSVSPFTHTVNSGLHSRLNGKSYTFTRLRRGYCESPTIYNQALKESLDSLVPTPGTALLQCVYNVATSCSLLSMFKCLSTDIHEKVTITLH